MSIDEKYDLAAYPCYPGVGGEHMTVAIGNVITNKVLRNMVVVETVVHLMTGDRRGWRRQLYADLRSEHRRRLNMNAYLLLSIL